ncbi:MAG: methionyl-tRNA formyltransferase [Actinobacteria bacterium HGW-Actinobacteria-7]|jgi:methionyl-tRNA formyltransferase|nr:MAG: methionyl-tRNA formyltransferase [Actinobacteria bacterium HGW-Actinobacteria-7]
MRVVFMGTPEFAVPSLRALAQEHQIVGVYTRPDAVSGRGSSRRPCAVKREALELGLSVSEPSSLRGRESVEFLRSLEPDVVVVAAYGMLLPPEILDVPRLGCINVHASLLPRWRGAAPIQWAILDGDEVTGVSIMQMEEGLDTGPVCATSRVEISRKSAKELTAELGEVGARTLLSALPDIESGRSEWIEQDDDKATYARKIVKADVAIRPGMETAEAMRRLRASSDQASTRVLIAGRGATLVELRGSDEAIPDGMVRVDRSALLLGLSDGAIEIVRMKPDGKSEMGGVDWARGMRVTGDEHWEGTL